MDDFRAEVVRIMNGKNEEDDEMVYYKTLADVPNCYKDAVQKVLDKGALDGNGTELNLSEDLCRTFATLDRLGQLNQFLQTHFDAR